MALTKGEAKMNKEEKYTVTMPPFPMPDPSDWAKQLGWNAPNFKEEWEKAIDWQKSNVDATKDQYSQFFGYMSDMLDSFVDAIPEETPWDASWCKPPKSVRKEMKEWEQMANDFFVEMADSWTDFIIQGQEKACSKIPEAEASAEAKGDVIEAKAEVVKDKPAK